MPSSKELSTPEAKLQRPSRGTAAARWAERRGEGKRRNRDAKCPGHETSTDLSVLWNLVPWVCWSDPACMKVKDCHISLFPVLALKWSAHSAAGGVHSVPKCICCELAQWHRVAVSFPAEALLRLVLAGGVCDPNTTDFWITSCLCRYVMVVCNFSHRCLRCCLALQLHIDLCFLSFSSQNVHRRQHTSFWVNFYFLFVENGEY